MMICCEENTSRKYFCPHCGKPYYDNNGPLESLLEHVSRQVRTATNDLDELNHRSEKPKWHDDYVRSYERRIAKWTPWRDALLAAIELKAQEAALGKAMSAAIEKAESEAELFNASIDNPKLTVK